MRSVIFPAGASPAYYRRVFRVAWAAAARGGGGRVKDGCVSLIKPSKYAPVLPHKCAKDIGTQRLPLFLFFFMTECLP